jgi:glutamate racemase
LYPKNEESENMVRTLKDAGVVQWIGLIISIVSAVAIGYGGTVWKLGVLKTQLTTDCEQIKLDIKRIDNEGTIKARQSVERIAILETQNAAVMQRLGSIETTMNKLNDNVIDILRTVQRIPGNSP